MTIWDWANLHPVAFTICVIVIAASLTEIFQAIFKKD